MKPISRWTMDELIEAHPAAVAILERHGVNPQGRCNHGVRHYLRLGQVLGRNCPVDDAAETLAELENLLIR